MINKRFIPLTILIIFVFLLIGCNQSPVTQTVPTALDEADSPTAVPVPTETSQPTEIPLPNKIILYAPAEVPAEEVNAAQTLISTLAGQAGLVFDVKMQLIDEDVDDSCAVVVLMSDSGVDVVSLAAQHPDTTVVVFGSKSIQEQPGNVVSFVADPYNLQFAAGFLSILIAPDWRLGGLLPWEDETRGALVQEAFTNGSAYYCGRCASTYMPVTLFPVINSLPSNSAPESWMNAITTLDNQYYLYTVYVSPEAASIELYQHLVGQNVTVVGATKPEGIEGLLWAASITQEHLEAFEENWDAIINGTLTENEIILPVVLSDVNEEYLSPGRMRLFDEMMEALTNGWVSPISPDYP